MFRKKDTQPGFHKKKKETQPGLHLKRMPNRDILIKETQLGFDDNNMPIVLNAKSQLGV